MSGYGGAHSAPTDSHVSGPISVGWVVFSAVLIGAGLFMLAYWLLTFNWFYFLGIASCVLGGLMLFSRRAGLDSA